MMNRDQYLQTFRAATVAKRTDYARRLAADWLSAWPGDGEVQLALAELEIDEKLFGTAIERLTRLVTRDPEDQQATLRLAEAYDLSGDPLKASVYRAMADALAGRVPELGRTPSWAQSLYQAMSAMTAGSADSALMHIRQVFAADLDAPLPTLVGVRAHLALDDRKAALGLARDGSNRWPETVAFRLWLASELLNTGDIERGVEYLHRAASQDPTGQIATRYLGPDRLIRDPQAAGAR
jgi:predicted Zn-dependent protease